MDPAQIDQILANLMVNARNAIAGIGLATIYGIVKQNNGFINVYFEQTLQCMPLRKDRHNKFSCIGMCGTLSTGVRLA